MKIINNDGVLEFDVPDYVYGGLAVGRRFKGLSGLLGGGGTSGSIEGQGVKQKSTLTEGQRGLLDALSDLLIPQVGQGITPFQGTRPGEVPFSPLQQQALDFAGRLGPGISAGLGGFGQFDPSQGQGFIDQAQGAIQQGLSFDPTQNILDALEPGRQLALSTFERDIIPDIIERLGAGSGESGALNKALAEAGGQLSLGLGAQAAPFLGQAALNQPGIQFQGANLFGGLSQAPGALAQQGLGLGSQGLQQLAGLGGLQQALPIGQAGAEQQRFLESQPFSNPFLTQFGPLTLGTSAFENIAFQGFREPSLLEKLAPIAGGALAASDERLKENVKPIEDALGKVSQLEGYTYNFIGQDDREGGIMAQELEKILPDAVVEVDGVKMVKYNAVLGLLVNAVNELSRKVG